MRDAIYACWNGIALLFVFLSLIPHGHTFQTTKVLHIVRPFKSQRHITWNLNPAPAPRDNKFLALAVYCVTDALVSSDDDLLVLNPYQGIAILTPKEFLQGL